jgi:two-component system nitrate/nitrite response regulator NarL
MKIREIEMQKDGAAATSRVLVTDSNLMGAQLLSDVLSRADLALRVVGFATTVDDVLEQVERLAPRVLLLNCNLGDGAMTGYRVLGRLRETQTEVRVVMLLNDLDPELVVGAFRGGARGVFCRAHSVNQLAKCIQKVDAGEIWAGQPELALLAEAIGKATPLREVGNAGNASLSNRERQILRLLAKGVNVREIARKMSLSEMNAARCLANLSRKLGVVSRIELTLCALEEQASAATDLSESKEAVVA